MSSSSSSSKHRDEMSPEEYFQSLQIPSKHRDGMSIDDYFDSIDIPIEDIELATNNFSDEYLLKQTSSGNVYYKGQLLLQSEGLINIFARKVLPDDLTMKEMIHSYVLVHKNIVSIFKISKLVKEEYAILINKNEVNGSLNKHLTSLTWIRRLHICVGVANALKYLHYDALHHDHVIHANINTSNILLDRNWEPKINSLGSALVAQKHRLHRTREYNAKLPYSDPEYANTHGLTHKTDVFSFGVLLFEVLFGREASIEDNDNWYFARLARSHYEDEKLDDLIDPDLRKQMNSQSLKIFAEAAYNCIKERWLQRPDMNQVLSKLKKALELQHKFEHPEPEPEATSASNPLSNPLKVKSFDHLRFRLQDIELATNNFSEKYLIGSGGFGEVYKAELENLVEINSLAIEEKDNTKISTKVSTVAIKRIFSRNDEQGEQGFISEIEMLSKCKHPNIVSLQGFCDEGKEMILVYEFVSNGSLADYFENIDSMNILTWAQRLQICLDIAHGLKYLHTGIEDKQSIIHRDIKSANILLDHEWVAKIADFGLSKLHTYNPQHSTVVTKNLAGTEVYLDPEYMSTGKLKAKSDVYSFGVVMFEIMCGKLAYDKTYGQKGLPTIVRQGFNERTLNNLVDPRIIEDDEIISMLSGGVDQDSLDTFTKVAYKCLAETQVERPTMEVVIEELEKALNFQISNKERLRISLKAIKLGTQNFNDSNCIGEERYWKLYEGEVIDANGRTAVIAKRWNKKSDQGHYQLLREFDTLSRYKHESIIGIVGYCVEMDENIIVYEHASNGRLFKHLSDPSLTWKKRLNICIDVASGIEFLHEGAVDEKDCVIHRDIKSSSILLDGGHLKAKIANFEFLCDERISVRAEHVDDNACDSLGYIDPKYQVNGFLTRFSDIYSLGVILIEMLCGRPAWAKGCNDHSQSLGQLAVRRYNERKNLNEMIFEGIKGQIATPSLTEFVDIAIRCLKSDQNISASEVVKHVKKALVFQNFNEENNFNISLEAIKLGTRNFSDRNCIGEGRFWKLYEGEIVDAKGCTTNIVAKRWDTKSRQRSIHQLQTELHILLHCKHDNIIGIIGYCIEMDENIIIYEQTSNGRLDKHLGDPSLTWVKRLKICIDVAEGLRFLHEDGINHEDPMKHRDIKSGSILLDSDWNAKISNFEFSCKTMVNDRVEHLDDNCSDSMGYVDPRYETDGFLTQMSDIYAFGVILIEVLCGRLAWGEECKDQSQSLGHLAIRHYNEKGNLDEMIFEGIKHQISPGSLTLFLKIAMECLDLSRTEYTAGLVKYLDDALDIQNFNEENNFNISLEAIKLGTRNFSDRNCIGEGRFWKLYEGEIVDAKGCTTNIVAKRWDTKSRQRSIHQLQTELHILLHCKHDNIIGIIGYCIEMDENIIIYEQTSNGRLDKHLGDPSLTWVKRLKICIDVAEGLRFLHEDGINHEDPMKHRDIKSGSILLDSDWNAKISNFEFSCKTMVNDRVEHLDDNCSDSMGYVDPRYETDGFLTQMSDIYAFGVILIEVLCGRLAWGEECKDQSQSLGPLAIRHYNEKGNLDEMIFEGIKQQISPRSLTLFLKIAMECLHISRRKYTNRLASYLDDALDIQKDHETWEPRLPLDYKEIIRASIPPINDSKFSREYIYDRLSRGVLLEASQRFFLLGPNGERSGLISARMFSYKNRKSRKWLSVKESRFEKVAQMLDISKLNIKIKMTTQILSPGVNYGAFLIFKLCDSKKISRKPMYVNLKYKMGGENLHAYFTTWKDDKWMAIELSRFFCHNKDTDFEVLLESFSLYYCGKVSICVEGIEFRVIDNVVEKNIKDIEQVQQIQKSSSKKDLHLNEVNNRQEHLIMLSAAEVLYDSSNVKHFHLHPSLPDSRYQEVVELLPQHVFRIKCKIESERLSQDTNYLCYLVFKLSEKCVGLHCPVRVRDLRNRSNKNAEFVYFRSPSPCNSYKNTPFPKQREDGWMEVEVWKFNSCNQLRNGCIPVDLKLITYEGNMSGLILCGMEFQPT